MNRLIKIGKKIGAGIGIILGAFVVLYVMGSCTTLMEKQKKENFHQFGVTNYSGYPAPESLLVAGGFYYCSFSLVEIRPDRTNYFAVLQQMVPNTNEMWRATNTNRFFELPQALTQGAIYLLGKSGTNVFYKPIATPSTKEIQSPSHSQA